MSNSLIQSATASATGKVILLGEHFVLYKLPALVAGIDRALHLTVRRSDKDQWQTPFPLEKEVLTRAEAARDCIRKQLQVVGQHEVAVSSNLPLQANLGSSAALCVALTRAFALLNQTALPPEQLLSIAQAGESAIHGKSSGIDTTMAALGGIRSFDHNDDQLTSTQITPTAPLHLVVVTTSKTTSTAHMVERVRAWVKANNTEAQGLFEQYKSNFDTALEALASNNIDTLGQCLNQGHRFLSTLEASIADLDTLCAKALSLGAPGAKLTGGGGGGSVLVLCRDVEQQAHIADQLTAFGTPYPVTIGDQARS